MKPRPPYPFDRVELTLKDRDPQTNDAGWEK
jgi:hypothetical protein